MQITNRIVRVHRGKKNPVDACTPYHFLHESERQKDGKIRQVNTIFLTNSECPFTCVMCDLWKNTLDTPTPAGAIPVQIEKALNELPDAEVIKLYNSGNFFDRKAIPECDYDDIARLLSGYERIIVENHPKLTGSFIADFNDLLPGQLEIAMGIETLHPDVLQKLNKNFTEQDVVNATRFLNKLNIDMRAFLLLNPPFLTDQKENEMWILSSQEKLFDMGFSACTLIPTRTGNGIMEQLKKEGRYRAPDLKSLERVFEQSLIRSRGRVFADTWDLSLFSDCEHCFESRVQRLEHMNLHQRIEASIDCMCNHNSPK